MSRVEEIRRAFKLYHAARAEFLNALKLPESNRDPLAEFSEQLVAALLGGHAAPSRVQAHWDVEAGDRKIQVKYLANPAGRWVNEHHIRVVPEIHEYAIVFFEALLPVAVVRFEAARLGEIGAALKKRHLDQDRVLQFTRANFLEVTKDPVRFEALGVHVHDLRSWANNEPGRPDE